MRRRTYLAAVAAGTLPLVAGCTEGEDGEGGVGGGGGDDDTPTETETETETATETERETETETETETEAAEDARSAYPDFNWDRLADAEPVGAETVALRDFQFEPLVAAVEPGTAVTFVNEDSVGHTVTIPTLSVDVELDGGEETTVTFDEAGTYEYVCRFHPPDMLGRMVVTDDPPAAATETATATETETETETQEDDDGGYY